MLASSVLVALSSVSLAASLAFAALSSAMRMLIWVLVLALVLAWAWAWAWAWACWGPSLTVVVSLWRLEVEGGCSWLAT